MRAIKPLKAAIHKISHDDQITPQHYMFILACIKAKCYTIGKIILDTNPFCIEPIKTGIESVDVRLYFYYGGVVYSALKMYKHAQDFFLNVISFPAFLTSEIMIEAYKKYVLVSLIHEGNVPSVSRFTGNGISRHIKQRCQAYEDLTNSYGTHSPEDFNNCIINHQDILLKDNNLGLARQVLHSLTNDNITKLTKTYITLSVKNIGEKAKIHEQEVEFRILKMIRKGQIYAQINQKDGMISFHENPDHYNTSSTMSYLDNNIHNTITLFKSVRSLDETITTSHQYIQKMVQSEKGLGRFGGHPSEFEGGYMEDPTGTGFRG